MGSVNLDVYLFFEGNAAEAMEFYKNIFGGELYIQKYDDVPGIEERDPGMAGKLMHAALRGGEITLLSSDSTQPDAKGRQKIQLTLGGEDEEKLTDLFNKLSEGGTIRSPLKKEFWGDIYGSLTDKFGVEWMVNISAKKE